MSYLNNPTQYVADLQAAADAENWEQYAAVQSQLAVESTLSALQQVQQQAQAVELARQEALREMESKHQGFLQLYGNNEVGKRFREKYPRIARAIVNAEHGQGSDTLPELYESFLDSASVMGLASKSSKAEPQPGKSTYGAVKFPSGEPESITSRSAARQQLISAFEEKYGDVSVDLADDSEEGKRTRRY